MILVTGATGYVGGHVLTRLAADGAGLRALVRRAGSPLPPGVERAVGDLTKPDSLGAAVAGVDVIVHAAAITANVKEPYPDAYEDINRRGTSNLVGAAGRAGVKRLVVISGLGTRPAPAGTYMATRWGLEEAVRTGAVPHVILQPSVLFGGGSEFVGALARLARQTPVVPMVGNGKLRFQPLWIEDLATCVVRAIGDEALAGNAIPLGGAEQLTFRELMQAIVDALGKRRLLAPVPMPLMRLQAALMTALLPRPPVTSAALELFGFENTTSLDSVEKTFGFAPVGFREHLRRHGLEG